MIAHAARVRVLIAVVLVAAVVVAAAVTAQAGVPADSLLELNNV